MSAVVTLSVPYYARRPAKATTEGGGHAISSRQEQSSKRIWLCMKKSVANEVVSSSQVPVLGNRQRGRATHGALWGVILFFVGIACFIAGAALGLFRLLLGNPPHLLWLNEVIVWYSAMPVVVGMVLFAYDLTLRVSPKRRNRSVQSEALANQRITVVLTAYNDELSIAAAVEDFKASPLIERVIVVSNNSTDATVAEAERAGATVFNEPKQGYGACVHRALMEGSRCIDTELVLLCEGDMTFRAADIPKFLAYIEHADIVNGTRIVEQLQAASTQVSTFIHYGNLAVGKLLEAKYLGEASITDVGTTYKLCRRSSLLALLPNLDTDINLEFNPYLLEQAILRGLRLIECPIQFHPRVGKSKGGNVSNSVALRVGLRMIFGICFGWKRIRT